MGLYEAIQDRQRVVCDNLQEGYSDADIACVMASCIEFEVGVLMGLYPEVVKDPEKAKVMLKQLKIIYHRVDMCLEQYEEITNK